MNKRAIKSCLFLGAILVSAATLNAEEKKTGPLASASWVLSDTRQLPETVGYNYKPASADLDERSRLIISVTEYGKITGLDSMKPDEIQRNNKLAADNCVETIAEMLGALDAKPTSQCDIGQTVGMCSKWTSKKEGLRVHGACIGVTTKKLQVVTGTVILFGPENQTHADGAIEAVLNGNYQ